MAEKNFAEGLRFSTPTEKAPAWIKGQISINVSEFVPWVQKNADERGWANIDVKESKKGGLYCELNTYKRDPAKGKWVPKPSPSVPIINIEEEEEGDMPF